MLEPNDYIVVRESDFLYNQVSVNISGMVNYPGEYKLTRGETLTDLIRKSGGLKKGAYIKGIKFIRNSVKNKIDNATNKVLLEEYKRLVFEKKRSTQQLQPYPQELKDSLTFLEEKLGKTSGRVLINYKKIKLGINNNITLQSDDKIIIPELPSEVQVAGAVLNPTSLLYHSDKPVSYYLNLAGGYTEFSSRDKVFIISADGTLRKYSKIQPGDTIYVGYEVKLVADWITLFREITQIIFNVASTAAFVNSLTN